MDHNWSSQKQLWKIIQKGNLGSLESFLPSPGVNASELLKARHKPSGDSVIHLASRHGTLHLVQYFHEHWKIGLELKNLDDKTPLHEASAGGHRDIVQYLLDHGVEVDCLKKSDWTPLMLACTKDCNVPVIEVLLERHANVRLLNKDGWNCFHIACRTGNVSAVTFLNNSDCTLCETMSNNGRTPLHTAALHDNYEVLCFLIYQCKCSLDAQDSCGSTPLMEAVKAGSMRCTEELLHFGADINLHDKVGRGAIHVAAECNQCDLIRLLINEHGVDPNSQTFASDREGCWRTALHWAYKEKQFDAMKVLKELGATEEPLGNNAWKQPEVANS